MTQAAWFDRMDRAFLADRLGEHAIEMRREGTPPSRVALSILVFFERELRRRGRAAEVPRLLAAAPAVLERLDCPVELLERRLGERALGTLVHELHDQQGWPKSRIVSALMCFSVLLDAHGRDDEAVLAELDRLTGFAPRERHLWPDEPHD